MFNFIKKLLGYPTDAEKAQATAQITETPLVQLGPEPVVETPVVETPAVEPAPVKSAPAVITAKKKSAQKKPATVKPTATSKPVSRTRGRKPKLKV